MNGPLPPRGVGGIKVSPNPAQEGGTITISGDPNSTVYISAPGNNSEVKLDGNGKATVKVPVKGGREFTVGDGKWPKPCEVVVEVVSSAR